MAAAAADEPLTPAARLFVQPQIDQVINCAMATDRALPDLDFIKSEIQNSLLLVHPKFRSLLVRDSFGREHWRPTDDVNLDNHLFFIHDRLSDDPNDEDVVNDYLADLSYSSPLPVDKPLWEIHILVAHKTAVVRVHHALGDGLYLMAILMSFCRRKEDPSRTPEVKAIDTSSFLPKQWSVWTVVKMIWFTVVYVMELVMKVLWMGDKTTAVSGGDGVEQWPRKLATATFRLEDMKAVKRAVPNSTINDVLFGIISMGLSRYLDIKSNKGLKDGDQITGTAMVNLRQQDFSNLMNSHVGTRHGNRFGMILFPVCYYSNYSDPLQFVRRAKAMIDKKKLSLEAIISYIVSFLVTCLFGAKLTSIMNYRAFCNTTFTISNVVGPQEGVILFDHPVKFIRVTSSSLPHAITMHMVSYAGVADMQILVAKEIIPDPKVLAKCFQDALLEMREAAKL